MLTVLSYSAIAIVGIKLLWDFAKPKPKPKHDEIPRKATSDEIVYALFCTIIAPGLILFYLREVFGRK